MEDKPKDNIYGGAIFALMKILHDNNNEGRNRCRTRWTLNLLCRLAIQLEDADACFPAYEGCQGGMKA